MQQQHSKSQLYQFYPDLKQQMTAQDVNARKIGRHQQGI
jgi:hypothetical protein